MERQNKNKKSENYLDFIPIHNEKIKSQADEDGNVVLFVENRGLFNRAAQVLFKKPRVSQIHLDEMGNFIWPLIDGSRTIYDIALMVREQFGEKAEPLYERLAVYIKTMEGYGFVSVKKQL